ncbi:hypothetical protein FJ942_21880 [Mesorhizobium sp. B2-4-2]|nr:hypothetical protein FJ426_25790 [Mesorhizobium sp. B2-6-4]TPL52335.1 hypothetical protein FJ942_21880 [Mesorhizobium sp. B2-4-2]TPN07077.1 hypothetical protein FJ973_22995 [Mesorhizobium sp. B2-1-3]TPN67171.1 hypothetical protein FJ986_11190 [Mesorhizobium sp. B1-1-1]
MISLSFFLLPCGRRWPREARSDEGCSREHQRLIPLEHPSTVSALRADPPSPTRGEGQGAPALTQPHRPPRNSAGRRGRGCS